MLVFDETGLVFSVLLVQLCESSVLLTASACSVVKEMISFSSNLRKKI
jgi:hypothetical protein